MSKVTFDLQSFEIPSFQFMGFQCALDTGAYMTVCHMTANVFELIFDYNEKSEFSANGYGGSVGGYRLIPVV